MAVDSPLFARTFGRTTVDPAGMRAQNAGLLLQLIWSEQTISRIELSRQTGLSPSTVTMIVTQLRELGLVQELGTVSSARGRRPTMLSFVADALYVVGVDLGIRHVSVAVMDLRGNVCAFEEQRHDLQAGPEATLLLVKELTGACLRDTKIPRRKLLGMGVGVPSVVRPERPGVLQKRSYPSWGGVDIRVLLHKSLRLRALVDNDANLGALAEYWWGGEHVEDLAYVKLGAGIGSGHILRGELYRGPSGTVGELGHVSIDPAGPACVCGAHGCIGNYLSSAALSVRAQLALGLPEANTHTLVERAHADDPRALCLLEQIAAELGQVLVGSLINLLNPSRIVLGGELTAAGDKLLVPLRRYVGARTWEYSLDPAQLRVSRLGSRATAVGAATAYLNEALRKPEQFLFPSPQ